MIHLLGVAGELHVIHCARHPGTAVVFECHTDLTNVTQVDSNLPNVVIFIQKLEMETGQKRDALYAVRIYS